MTAPVTIHLGSLVIDEATLDADGVTWGYESIDGWWSAPPTRVERSEVVPQGETITVARFNARALTLRLFAFNPNVGFPLTAAQTFAAARTVKLAANGLYVPVLLKVTDPALSLQSYVRMAGGAPPVDTQIVGNFAELKATVLLVAADPRRYSQTAHTTTISNLSTATSNSGTVTNAGDQDAPVVITIDGPAVNPKVTNSTYPGAPYIQYVGTLATPDLLVLDPAAATYTVNGVDVSTDIHVGSRPWMLAAGNNTVTYVRDSGASSSSAAVAFRDAYS